MKPYEKMDALVEEIVFAVATERMLLDQEQLQTEPALKLRAEKEEKLGLAAKAAMEEAFYVFLHELHEIYGPHLSEEQHAEVVRRANKDAETGSRKSLEEKYVLYASLLNNTDT